MTKLELNGVHSVEPSRSPPRGIYAPTITIFTNDKKQDLDLDALAVHVVRYFTPSLFDKVLTERLARAGITGIVIQGSNGEAVHLTHHERSLTVRTVRKALDEAGYHNFPLIVGTGASSVRETVILCKLVRPSDCFRLICARLTPKAPISSLSSRLLISCL